MSAQPADFDRENPAEVIVTPLSQVTSANKTQKSKQEQPNRYLLSNIP